MLGTRTAAHWLLKTPHESRRYVSFECQHSLRARCGLSVATWGFQGKGPVGSSPYSPPGPSLDSLWPMEGRRGPSRPPWTGGKDSSGEAGCALIGSSP